ncbi:MAG: SPASM domain-containing protein [Bacteroidales bacterium]|jgi:radical SAM protein with 4Fe4S-binding SPASM domain|nr:SPASM domain-containing protein [Bacteroidales bacterium]
MIPHIIVKQANAAAAAFSFLASVVTRGGRTFGMPPAAGIELTNHCNLKCPECSSGSGMMKRERGFMSLELFEKAVSELRPFLYNMNLYFQGEPMMHPDFFGILEKCRGINTTLSTNGHFLTGENAKRIVLSGLRRIIISLDGMDQQTYSAYRVNGDFEKVVKGIRNISAARQQHLSGLKMIIQFLVNSRNEHQIESARKLASETGAELRLKTMQIIRGDHAAWLPADERYSRYRRDGSRYIIRNRFSGRCLRVWYNPLITWDGKVIPCCFDKDADHVMGDLTRNSFREIWQGQEFRRFRESVVSGRKDFEICRNCTSGFRLS